MYTRGSTHPIKGYNTPQSSQDTIPYQDVETEEPIITEDEVEHLNSNGSDDGRSWCPLAERAAFYQQV